MKIKYEIEVTDKQIGWLRERWKTDPEYFLEYVDEVLEQGRHYANFMDLAENTFKEMFEDEEKEALEPEKVVTESVNEVDENHICKEYDQIGYCIVCEKYDTNYDFGYG